MGEVDLDDDATCWRARALKEAAVHPDTGLIIPRPFRMSGYVPYNGPVCVAMMVSTGTGAIAFWNWINQSQNALVNYCNRNASSPTPTSTLVRCESPSSVLAAPLSWCGGWDVRRSYCSAVGASLVVGLGLSSLIKARFPPATAAAILKFVAFPTAMVSSALNCFLMRSPEIGRGISLTNRAGEEVAGGARAHSTHPAQPARPHHAFTRSGCTLVHTPSAAATDLPPGGGRLFGRGAAGGETDGHQPGPPRSASLLTPALVCLRFVL